MNQFKYTIALNNFFLSTRSYTDWFFRARCVAQRSITRMQRDHRVIAPPRRDPRDPLCQTRFTRFRCGVLSRNSRRIHEVRRGRVARDKDARLEARRGKRRRRNGTENIFGDGMSRRDVSRRKNANGTHLRPCPFGELFIRRAFSRITNSPVLSRGECCV